MSLAIRRSHEPVHIALHQSEGTILPESDGYFVRRQAFREDSCRRIHILRPSKVRGSAPF